MYILLKGGSIYIFLFFCNYIKRKKFITFIDSIGFGSLVYFCYYRFVVFNSNCFLFSLYKRCFFVFELKDFLLTVFDFESLVFLG